MNTLKLAKNGYIVISLLLLLAGISYILCPSVFSNIPIFLIGGILAIYGVIKIVGFFARDLYCLAFQYDLAFGILWLVLSVILLVRSQKIAPYLIPGLGVLVLADCLFKFQMSWDAKRFGLDQWYVILIFSLLGSLFGALILFDALHGGQPTRWLIGGALLLEGLMNLCVTVYTVFLRTPPDIH